MGMPGVGPLIASAMVAAIGNGAAFIKGRDFAACLGLVPKQISTGDRTVLGGISRRGNRYLCTLFVQGARPSSSGTRAGLDMASVAGLRMGRSDYIKTCWLSPGQQVRQDRLGTYFIAA